MNLTEKEEFTEKDILQIIESKLEESINIEFKNAKALSNDKMVKKEISKDISSFANSDGGIIFYGIDEENHVASKLSFIDGNIFSKEWLENIIISTIQQKIENLKIIPVRFEGDIKKSIYVVKIPKSFYSPHLNGDKKYYKRYNFQSVPMEEYEVRNLYLKTNESKVFVYNILVKPAELENLFFTFFIETQVMNDGNYISEKYKTACNISDAVGISINIEKEKEYTFTNKLEDGVKLSTTKNVALFPNEILNALSFTLKIPKEKFDDIIKTIKFNFIIFSANELDQNEINVAELLVKTKNEYYK